MSVFRRGYNIFKYMVFAAFIFLCIVGIVIFFTANSLGVMVKIPTILIGVFMLLFGIIGYVYENQKVVTLGKRTVSKNIFTVMFCSFLVVVVILSGFIVFFVTSRTTVKVGISWYYFFDQPIDSIATQVQQIHDDGFMSIRIQYATGIKMPSKGFDGSNNYKRFQALVQKADQLEMEIYCTVPTFADQEFRDFAIHFAQYVDIWQMSNEIDIMHWNGDNGTAFPYTREEMQTIIKNLRIFLDSISPNSTKIVNFSSAFAIRIDWVILSGSLLQNGFQVICDPVDYVGYDIYMQEGQALKPFNINYLHSLTQKTVWITEAGCSTMDDDQQATYLIDVLNYASKNGIDRVWLCDWLNNTYYGIIGRKSETEIKNWIASNGGDVA